MKWVAFEKNEKKLSAKERWFVFTIVVLSVLLLISFYLIYTKTLYRSHIENIGQITVGQPAKIYVDGAGSFSQAFSFYGSMLPEISINQDVSVVANRGSGNLVMRLKVFASGKEQGKIIHLGAGIVSDFVQQGEYFYYNNILTENVALKVMQSVVFPNEIDLISSQLYDFVVTIETLPVDCDFLNIWNVEQFLEEGLGV